MIRHRNIRLLAWFNFFSEFRFSTPILILYFSQITNSYSLGASIIAIIMLSSAILDIPTGALSDHIGRKKTIIVGSVAATFAAIIFAIGQSFWLIGLGAILDGFSRAMYSGNNHALLHDTLRSINAEHHYHGILGKISAPLQIALAISSLLGGALAVFSFSLVMQLSVIAPFLSLIISLFLHEPIREAGLISRNALVHIWIAFKQFLRNARLRFTGFAGMIEYGIGEASFQFEATFFAILWPVWAIGIAKMLAHAAAAISYFFSGTLIDRLGERTILLLQNIISRIIYIISLGFPTILSPALISGSSIFFGVRAVAENTLQQHEFTNAQRATMGSITTLGGNILMSIALPLLGLLADLIGPAKALLLFEIFHLIPLWLYWKLRKR